jgi:hypothetical protein
MADDIKDPNQHWYSEPETAPLSLVQLVVMAAPPTISIESALDARLSLLEDIVYEYACEYGLLNHYRDETTEIVARANA